MKANKIKPNKGALLSNLTILPKRSELTEQMGQTEQIEQQGQQEQQEQQEQQDQQEQQEQQDQQEQQEQQEQIREPVPFRRSSFFFKNEDEKKTEPKTYPEFRSLFVLQGETCRPLTRLSSAPDIIRVINLSFWYDQVQALKNLNIEIRKNQITALIGPSGCGKSTFLRCLNGMNDLILKTRTEGRIEFHGRDINRDFERMVLRKRVGMVFQKPNPFDMSIYNNVAYGPKLQGIKNKAELDEIVERSLKKAAIWDEVKDRLRDNGVSLSGGQQQRLCIARTLATNPEIILMDEPTSALDPVSTQKIEQLMEELKEEYTVVIVTHNMQQAGRIADETVFFLNGEIIERGPTAQIFTKPKDKRTEDYITGRFS